MSFVNRLSGPPVEPPPEVPEDTEAQPLWVHDSMAALAITMVFSGVDTSTPMDVTPTTATGVNSRHADPPSITPSTSGAEILAAGGAGAGVSAQSCSNMTGMLSRTAGGSSWSSQGGMCRHDWTSGAFDPAQFTGGSASSNDAWCAATIALRPETPGVTPTYVGGVMLSYHESGVGVPNPPAPAPGYNSLTIPLNTGLTGGSRDHVEVGDIVVVALIIGSGIGDEDLTLSMITTGYTTICDLFGNDTRDTNFAMFYKIVEAV